MHLQPKNTLGLDLWPSGSIYVAIPRLGLLGSRDLPRSFPNVEVIQTAYDREEAAGSTLHSKDLKVLQAKCRDNPGGPFLCEVTLTVTWTSQDPDQRLVFDVVAVARTSDGGAGYAGADAVPRFGAGGGNA